MAEWRGRRVGPYELVDRLGHGGMGVVYKAVDTVLDRPVAIKMIQPTGDDTTNAEQNARFLVEAKAAARIQSRHVAQVLQFGQTEEGEVYIAMELLRGQTLSKLLQKEHVLTTWRAVRIARHIARGMQSAHALGIVHRDLKPANVMLVNVDGEEEVAKILDFGVAKLTKEQTGGLTQQGALLGTLPFMAPEQIESRNVDARTDVYALGCILYRMLTGTPLFDVESLSDLVRHQLSTLPEPLRERAPDANISPEIERVVLRCLEKSMDKRYPSMAELDAALANAVGQNPESSTPKARPPQSRREETLPTGTKVDVSEMATLISVDMEFSGKNEKVGPEPSQPLVDVTMSSDIVPPRSNALLLAAGAFVVVPSSCV
jgi:eukaryotic-like serine/threonine-protein kinase